MKKAKIISVILVVMSILMVSLGIELQAKADEDIDNNLSYNEVNINNITETDNVLSSSQNLKYREDNSMITPIEMETTPASVIIPPRIEVFDGLTIEELTAKLDRNLGTDIMAGKGYIIAVSCIERGIDPYVATAIILHETGCGSRCSNLARNCYNVGGQKGGPTCNGGSYKRFNTLDEGIIGFIDNLYKNYYSVGLDTIEKMARKYAEGSNWPNKINYYVNRIRNN